MLVRSLAFLGIVSVTLFMARTAVAQSPGDKTIESATEVLTALVRTPDEGIPAHLLAEAQAVAIIPNTIKVGLIVGGQHGKGVVVVKEKNGTWRAPSFITMTGGSVGYQIGVQGADIVLVFRTAKSVDDLMKGTFKIGADAAAAAGPVGRRVEAATNETLKAEILSYSRSRGLFAGVSVDGSVIHIDSRANAGYYGTVAQGQVVPQPALKLVELIAQLATPQAAVAAQPVAVQGGPAAPVAAAAAAPPQADSEATKLKQQLAQAAIQLNSRLDDSWRQYLALPAEVYRDGTPPLNLLKTSLSRFDAVAADPRYSTLVQQPEFQTTRTMLNAYVTAVSAYTERKLTLPPPPSVPR